MTYTFVKAVPSEVNWIGRLHLIHEVQVGMYAKYGWVVEGCGPAVELARDVDLDLGNVRIRCGRVPEFVEWSLGSLTGGF